MRLLAFLSLLVLVLHEAGTASLPGERKREEQSPEEGDTYAFLHVGNYALSLEDYSDVIDLNSYEEPADYGDQTPEAKVDSLALPTRTSPSQSTVAPNLTMTKPTTTSLLTSQSSHGLPTCLVCVCLGSSVYCDDANLKTIPPLPQMTTYLYARFNHISHIQAGDFKGLTKLKRIDLSSNSISSIHNDAFRLLPALQDLILSENQLAALPVLPNGIEFLDVRLNRLQSSGIQPDAFVIPGLFTPALFTQDLLTPDLLTPDLFIPDLLTPELLTPDLFTPELLTPELLTHSDLENSRLSVVLTLTPAPTYHLNGFEIYHQALEKLQFLYLADNLLESIPGPLPLSLRSLHLQNNMIETMERNTFCGPREHSPERRQLEDIRLDRNPINLSLFPEAYFCLPRLPVGRFT
ncbi:Opticin [Microtus ochrogaster]|uniref:Opticin n=1 Tax=Microtus ochrogaster TaxID=79684 RepID=A0A8J6GZW5_MICOH|nr:Opticin [Microtus ochrogaster]